MATLAGIKGKKRRVNAGPRRVSPLKPGLRGLRNWTTAQIRGAGYSKAKRMRLIWTGLVLVLGVIWGGLWLGGFLPDFRAAGERGVKTRLMSMGFVVERIDVVGEGRISESQIRSVLGVKPGDYLFDMDIKTAQKRVQSLPWVETAVVRRLWPNRLVVHINERVPYALWQYQEKLHLIDKAGIVIAEHGLEEFSNFPMVVGKGANIHAAEFQDMVARQSLFKAQTLTGIYVGERRWDIDLQSKKGARKRILLPAAHPDSALGRLQSYQRLYGLLDRDIHRIDLRVRGRIFLTPERPIKLPKRRSSKA